MEARLEEERKKKLKEEKEAAKAEETEKAAEAAKRAVSEKELLDLMEMEDDESANLEGLVRDLEKETEKANSLQKKRSRNKEDTRTKSYAMATSHTATLRQGSFIPHNYRHPRAIVEGSARLSGEDKVAQFIGLVGTLLTNGKMVDPFFVLNPTIIVGGRKDLRDTKDVPVNMTALWNYVKISEKSMQTFQPKSGHTGGGKKWGGGNNSQYADQVYFTMVWSCDIDPWEIISGIILKWMRAGGMGLFKKEIQAIDTFLPFVILKLSIYVGVHMLVAEFKKLMEERMRMMEEEAMADGEALGLVLPPFAFRKSPPKLPGLDPVEYAGLPSRQTAARHAWHVEMEKQHVHLFRTLIEKAKDFNLFEDLWGKHVLISEVVDFNSSQGAIERLMKEAKKHTCFQVSMSCKALVGVLDIDAEVAFKVDDEGKEVGGRVSLRNFLPFHLRTRDNKSPLLLVEMHQRQTAAPVEVVIPNTEEAEAMIGDFNRNAPAFLKFYLMGIGFNEAFVVRLIQASCCPIVLGKMNGITWNKKRLELILPEDVRDKEGLAAFENQEWYFNLKNLRVSPKKGTQNYTAPEALFNLDADKSVATLHAKNDARRAAAKDLGDSDSEEEDTDSASNERDHGKSPDGETADMEDVDSQKLISWGEPPSGPSDGHLPSHAAAGGR